MGGTKAERLNRVQIRTASLAAALVTATVALVSAALPPALIGPLNGLQVFPPSNWWHLDISQAPLDPNSAAYINFVSGRTASNPTATRRVHPDFGGSPYGFPYVVVSGDQPLVQPTWVAYGDESDNGAPGRPVGYPIPSEARTIGGYIEGAEVTFAPRDGGLQATSVEERGRTVGLWGYPVTATRFFVPDGEGRGSFFDFPRPGFTRFGSRLAQRG